MHSKDAIAAVDSLPAGAPATALPAGAGIALAVLVGSLVWMGIFALMM